MSVSAQARPAAQQSVAADQCENQRGILEHAIAVLIGQQPASFSLAPPRCDPTADSAGRSSFDALGKAAGRGGSGAQNAASNAQIVSPKRHTPEPEPCPVRTSYSNGTFSRLLSTSNRVWSLGPQLAETLIDGGLRRAQVAGRGRPTMQRRFLSARPCSQAPTSRGRIVTLRVLEQQAVVEDSAVAAAREAERLTLNQYKAGTVPYSSVITAQTTRLSSERRH